MSPRTSAAERVAIFAAVSRLLQYPDELLMENLPLVAKVAGGAPAGARERLASVIAHMTASPLLNLQAEYVETFDLKRRNCLYLTYRQTGDTRRRGMALLRFQDLYRKRGYSMNDGELPDYLPALLELAAEAPTGDKGPFDLLLEHQPEIAVLHRSLSDSGSPYANAVAALMFVLPQPSAAVLEAARKIAEDGPPEEQVGIAPFVVAEPVSVGS
jgi:nitrate reductase molybdenum cofactor assembly chaperone NarJ/NarW